MLNNDIKFWVPIDITKSGKGDSKEMYFKGLASTGSVDADDEFLDPTGFDLSDFKYVNWNHMRTPDGYIGEPVNWEITKDNKFLIEGKLWGENPLAVATYNMFKALKKSDRGTKLGLSVEGKVLERDSSDRRRVSKAKLTAVAICPFPKNSDTWADFVNKGQTNISEWEYDILKSDGNGGEEYILDLTHPETGVRYLITRGGELKVIDKSMSAEDESGKAVSLESVDSKKKNIENLCESVGEIKKSNIFTPNLKLDRSIYKVIYDRYPDLDLVKSKNLFKFIRIMADKNKDKKEVGKEDITKSLDILEKLSSGDYEIVAKGNKDTDSVQKSELDLSIEKAQKELEDLMNKKNGVTTDKTEKSDNFDEFSKMLKGQSEIIQKGFGAMKSVIKSHSEETEALKKSLEDLNERFETIESNSKGKRSVISKGYVPEAGEGVDKDKGNGKVQLKLESRKDRNLLVKAISDTVPMEGATSAQISLLNDVSYFESTGELKTSVLQKANELGYDVTKLKMVERN